MTQAEMVKTVKALVAEEGIDAIAGALELACYEQGEDVADPAVTATWKKAGAVLRKARLELPETPAGKAHCG